MKALRPTFVLTTVLTLLLGALIALPASADRPPPVAGPDRVVPVGDTVFGQSYADWSIAWWRWVFTTPSSADPFGDGLIDCTTNQPDPRVLFLAGPFNETATVERTCEAPISTSTYIFLPVINVECSDLEIGTIFGGQTAAERLACVQTFPFSDLEASFNGRTFQHLEDFLVISPDFAFTATANPDNRGGVAAGPGHATSSGIWLMLRPFPRPGEYVIRFTGTIDPVPGGGTFTPKATYHISVA